MNIGSIRTNGIDLSPSLFVGLCVCVSLSVLLVRKVYYGKRADFIQMPSCMVSGVGRGMGVLDGDSDCPRERGSFVGEFGRPFVTNGEVVA